jgi:pseudomonalisin
MNWREVPMQTPSGRQTEDAKKRVIHLAVDDYCNRIARRYCRVDWVVATLIFSSLACSFQIPCLAQSANSTTQQIEGGSRITLRGQHPAWAMPSNNQGPIPDDTKLEHLILVLKRSHRRQRSFEYLLKQQQKRDSSFYHHWLTPVEIGNRFGPDQQDIDAVIAWLRHWGLEVDSVANSRMMIDFSGSASQVDAAFSLSLQYYLVNGELRLGSTDDPTIPSPLASVIQSVKGFYTIQDREAYGLKLVDIPVGVTGSPQPDATFCKNGTCTNYIFPADFATIYDLNPVYSDSIDGTGQTIALVGRSRVYIPDIENFETVSGLPVKDPTIIVPPNGLDPGPPAGVGGEASDAQKEATLDVTRSTSVAPGASINLIVSLNTASQSGIAIDAEYVVDTNPVPAQILSFSFLECEAAAGGSGVQFWDTLFSQAAGEGISVFVASGDAGAAGCDTHNQQPPPTQSLSINAICSSSYATCVGGTEFADAANPGVYWKENPSQNPPYESALGYIPEGAWNEPLNEQGEVQASASGGGYSVYIPAPPWQTGTGVPGTQGRYTPDIAFSSSIHDGYFACLEASGTSTGEGCVVQNGNFYFGSFYGTSAAAPDMAGITALLDQKMQSPQGELNQRLYELAAASTVSVFHDITVASSGVSGCVVITPSMCNNSTPSPTSLTGGLPGYLVTEGYDEVTGLGSIDVASLLGNWPTGLTTTTTTLTSSASTIASGVPVTFTASVTGSTPAGKVSFLNGAYTIGSAQLNDGGEAYFTTTLSAVGSDLITAIYEGDPNNQSSTSAPLTENVTAASFTISVSPTAQTISSNSIATFTMTVTPQGEYTSPITFTAVLSPTSNAQVTFNPSVIVPGASPATTTMTIQVTRGGTSVARANDSDSFPIDLRRLSPFWAFSLLMPIGFINLIVFSQRRPRWINVVRSALLWLILSPLVLTMTACWSSIRTYSIQITATGAGNGNSEAVTTSASVMMNVQN